MANVISVNRIKSKMFFNYIVIHSFAFLSTFSILKLKRIN